MHQLPKVLHSTKQALSDQITASIRTDRMFILELGKNTVIIFSPAETAELCNYLLKYRKFFETQKGGQP